MSVLPPAGSGSAEPGSAVPPIPPRIRLHLEDARTGEPKPYLGKDTPTPAFGRTLSIALAMKGGVSLAVWIGGAVSEIDILRRIRIVAGPRRTRQAYFIADPGTRRVPDDAIAEAIDHDAQRRELDQTLVRADQYARLLVSRGYDSVDVDVLAGASAGGLNAVLYAVAQRAGVSVDPLLTTWTSSGSAWRLLRPPGFSSVPSILMGDDFFWPRVREAIQGFYGWNENELAIAPELTVDLSATISDREYLSSAGAHEGRGHFHFVGADPVAEEYDVQLARYADPTAGRAIPRGDDDRSTDRLAYAARTTSSFPGAFEQARIWSHPALGPSLGAGTAVDMSFAFSSHRGSRPDRTAIPYQVLDGGVLDNIPIDRLTRAIRDRTPRNYGDRIAIYLDPSPDALPLAARKPVPSSPPQPNPRKDRRRGKQSFLGTVGNGIFMRGIRESADDEIAALDDLREAALYETARAGSFALSARGLLPLAPPSARRQLASTRRSQYVLYRAIADADMWKRVLGNPDLWQLTTDLATRSVWPTATDAVLRTIDAEFEAKYVEFAKDADKLVAILGGSQGLRDAALCALDWMRDLEDFASSPTRKTTPAFESQRNQLRKRIHFIARQALRLRDERTRTVLDAVRTNQTATRVIEEWLVGEVDPEVILLWNRLNQELTLLRRFTRGLASTIPAGQDDWRTPWRWFPREADAAALAPFIAAEGIPDPVQVEQFAQITANEATAFQTSFSPLVSAQRAEIVSRWLALPWNRYKTEASLSELTDLTLDPGAKLAGSTLGNFGAFFSRVWRVNDWWWGRLDASAGMLRVLSSIPAFTDPGSVPDDTAATEDPLRVVQAAILRQASVAPKDNRPFMAPLATDTDPELIAAHMSAGAHTLARLSPDYLVSVGSRAVRVALRALWSGQNVIIRSAASVILPPILSLVPLVFAPLRFAFLLSLMFAVLPWAAGKPQPVHWADWPAAFPGWVLFAAALTVSLFPLFGVVSSWSRLRKLTKKDRSGDRVLGLLGAEIRSSTAISALLMAASVAALGALLAHNINELQVDASSVYLAIVAALSAFAARGKSRSLSTTPIFAENVLFLVLTFLAILVMFDPGLIAGAMAALSDPDQRLQLTRGAPTVIIGLSLGVVQAVLSWGWLGGFTDPGRRIGLIHWVGGILIVAVSSGLVVWLVSVSQNRNAIPGLVTGLAVWFVASQLGWWIGEVPRNLAADIDNPRFATGPSTPSTP